MSNKVWFSNQNRYQFGFNSVAFSMRKNLEDTFFARFPKCSRSPLSFLDECKIAAQEIAMTAKGPITVLLSGGMDSEIVCESFRLANIEIHAAVFEFLNGLNKFDVDFAKDYCQRRGIKLKVYKFDVIQFYNSSEIRHLAELTLCPYPMLCTQMKMFDLLTQEGNFVVGGGSDPRYFFKDGQWRFFTEEFDEAIRRFQSIKNFQSIVSFFIWNPEVFVSYLKSPKVEKLISSIPPTPLNSTVYKFEMYSQFFELKFRVKHRGYESFVSFHRNKTQELINHCGHTFDQVQYWRPEELTNLAKTEP